MFFRKRIYPFRQYDSMDCGPTCLRIVAKYYGRDVEVEAIRKWSGIARDGVSLFGLDVAAKKLGFTTNAVLATALDLIEHFDGPCIVHWNQKHFMVCYKITSRRSTSIFHVVDPAQGWCKFSMVEFRRFFETHDGKGVVLFLTPGEDFTKKSISKSKLAIWSSFLPYVQRYKRLFFHILIFLLITSALGFIFPVLTQKIIDDGVQLRDKHLIGILVFAQLGILISRFCVDFLRSWALLQINYKVDILFLSDFLRKVVRLPLTFFDTKNVGDIMQRIEDNSRVESFLTGESFLAVFSIVNLAVFSALLGYYKLQFLLIFVFGNTIYVIWVLLFLKYRRELDNRRFAQSSGEQSRLIQLITGISEVKINRSEEKEIWGWERLQAGLYKISLKGLLLSQVQRTGGLFFCQFVNLAITYLAAISVVNEQLTIGEMMSIMFVIGQLSAPVEQLIQFVRSAQDASISIGRLHEIQMMKDEHEGKQDFQSSHQENISVLDLSFSYNYPEDKMVIHDLNLIFPRKKVTAIVGASGSGKTTLIKLLLGLYTPTYGKILVGDNDINTISPFQWRAGVGAVLQDGLIFSATIAENIALSDLVGIDLDRVIYAAKVACIHDYIEMLPLKYHTHIGMEGTGLSQGQKQRILIARMVYKNPSIIFLDEATNALDANNEKEIMNNLKTFCQEKTVVVVAHRLSTVKDADNIMVMEQGRVVEQGTHEELASLRGYYYNLVKNQLELGQ